jgi:hypothetical protein
MTMTEIPGRHDFDFLHGAWRIHNRKLIDVFDPNGTEWIEFDATSEAWPIVGGLGNVDTFDAPEFPGRGHFQAATLRMFDLETGEWRIWWLPPSGQLDTPMRGRFDGGRGVFYGDELVDGTEIRVRFDWTPGENDIRWEQLLSFDGGETWRSTWVMTSKRIR